MKTFTVTRDAFTTTVQADDAQGAILAMVRDAGYDTIADAAEVCGETEQDFIDAQIVEEDENEPGLIKRACYFVSADGQSDMLLAGGGDQADLTDDELVEAAVAEAHAAGLLTGEYDPEEPHLITEDMLRDGLSIGEYRL